MFVWILTVTVKDERDRDTHQEMLRFEKRETAEKQLTAALARGDLQSQALAGNKHIAIQNEIGEQIGFNLFGYRSHRLATLESEEPRDKFGVPLPN